MIRLFARSWAVNRRTYLTPHKSVKVDRRCYFSSNIRENGLLKYVLYTVPAALVTLGGSTLLISLLRRDVVFGDDVTEVKGCRKKKTLEEAILESRDLVQRVKDEVGCPGVVVGVSLDGQEVWKEGFGYADLENRVPCNPETVMRIASISKVITTTIAAKLMENKVLDIDKPVQHYVKEFPEKTFNGEKVTITTRQLMCHLSGLRHYTTADMLKKQKENNTNRTPETESKELLIKDHYSSVSEALKLFKDDELIHKPGSAFLYSTHAWTLVSAVLEGASKKEFPVLLKNLFKDLGLNRTYLDEREPLIYGRARFYMKHKKTGKIVNTPYVDNSYKWAGGGMLSTIGDLIKFGNAILYSSQWMPEPVLVNRSAGTDKKDDGPNQNSGKTADEISDKRNKKLTKTMKEIDNKQNQNAAIESKESDKSNFQQSGLPGYLSLQTINKMWTRNEKTKCGWDANGGFGLGWAVVPFTKVHGCAREQKFYISHTGGAFGASSALVLLPRDAGATFVNERKALPQGVVVAIFTNLSAASLRRTASEIAELFADVER